jgi:hypothetical protein
MRLLDAGLCPACMAAAQPLRGSSTSSSAAVTSAYAAPTAARTMEWLAASGAAAAAAVRGVSCTAVTGDPLPLLSSHPDGAAELRTMV